MAIRCRSRSVPRARAPRRRRRILRRELPMRPRERPGTNAMASDEPVEAIFIPEASPSPPARPVPVPVPVQVPEIGELTAQVALLTAHVRALTEPLAEIV